MAGRRVLVVEDEANLLDTLRYNLEREGYEVHTAVDGAGALEATRTLSPNLVLLDIMLPVIDGLEVCRMLRRETDVPILMLTARGEEIDRVVGLELGADDYVTKPFSMRELMARAGALLRRAQASWAGDRAVGAEVLCTGELVVDVTAHKAWLDGREQTLKPREFALLVLLMRNVGRVLRRDEILDSVWGEGYVGDGRTVDVHIHWLREKIEADTSSPATILTIRGVGYRFEA